MLPRVRKFVLAVHLVSSLGWLGAGLAYLALVVVVLPNQNIRTVRDAIFAMESIVWFVILPRAIAALLTGLVIALATPWGLFRHYWVLVSLVLTTFGVLVLTEYSLVMREMGTVAAKPILTAADLAMLKSPTHAYHSAGGILLLTVVTVLNIYKPRGLTRRGRRQLQEARAARTGAGASVVGVELDRR